MAEAVKKAVKTEKPKADEKATKDAAIATLHALAKPVSAKAVVAVVKPQSEVDVKAPAELQAQAPKSEIKPEAGKEADPGKEFVDSIMTEMALKGASKKRLIKKLAEQFNFDKQKVLFRLRRALITERYAAAHEAGH